LLATNQFARLVEIYSTVQNRNIINLHHAFVGTIFGQAGVLVASALLGGKALYDQSALASTIAANVDFQRIKRQSDKTLLIYTTVDLRSGELVMFNSRDHSPGLLAEALLASTTIPVLMDPVEINVDGQSSQYVDGGVREFLPLRAIFDSGVELDHVIAISTSPLEPKLQPSSFGGIVQILGRTVDLLSSEVGRNDYSGAVLFNTVLQMIDNSEKHGISRTKILRGIPREIRSRLPGKRAIPVTFIGPSRHIEMNALEFEPAAMRKLMKEGVRAAKAVVPKIVAQLQKRA
jgi:predicted acylesterase/phospholipase RssA